MEIDLVIFVLGISSVLAFLVIGAALVLSRFNSNKVTDFDKWLEGGEEAIPYNPKKEYDGIFHDN